MGRCCIGGIDVATFLRQDLMKQLDGLRPGFFSPIIPETHVLGTSQAIVAIDETSFPKRGAHSAGGKKQYCGAGCSRAWGSCATSARRLRLCRCGIAPAP